MVPSLMFVCSVVTEELKRTYVQAKSRFYILHLADSYAQRPLDFDPHFRKSLQPEGMGKKPAFLRFFSSQSNR